MPCTTVTLELLMHTPASIAATAICSRASASAPSAYATGRCFIIRFTALTASASVAAVAFTEISDSTAWVSASSPVAAVTRLGAVIPRV